MVVRFGGNGNREEEEKFVKKIASEGSCIARSATESTPKRDDFLSANRNNGEKSEGADSGAAIVGGKERISASFEMRRGRSTCGEHGLAADVLFVYSPAAVLNQKENYAS